MPFRLNAIGFQDTSDEEALLSVLNTVIESAIRTDPSKIVYKPFEECMLTISLGTNGQPKHIDISLGETPQTCLPYKFENHGIETFVSAFTCIDGKPITPIWFWTPTETIDPDLVVGKVVFGEIKGFAETFEKVETDIDDMWIRAPESGNCVEFQGVALAVNEHSNFITKSIVTLCRINLPGIVIPVCMQGRTNIEPGMIIRGVGVFYGNLHPA
ncbi:MAG TPA: hypothetical protein VNK96_07575 [Fimbriimonadales bacterium]|nr:hypothetical protein [Fimbriimonadales bacterium]